MATALPHDVVDLPAEEGARLVALDLLREASDGARRLDAGNDAEALHDFRVGLRRLRTALRAFAPWLEGSVGLGMRRRLKRIARATNEARDAEVQLAWVGEQRGRIGERQRAGYEWLLGRLGARLDSGGEERREALRKFGRRAQRLERRLGVYQSRVGDAAAETLGAVLAALVAGQAASLREKLAAVTGPGDQERIHLARIEAKRLRYLLEPLRGNRHADSGAAVRVLKRLQDVLGELHDAHVLAGSVAAALVDAAAERARRVHVAVYEEGASEAKLRRELVGGVRSGLLALDRLVRERRDALFADLERDWRAGGLDALGDEVGRVVARLEGRAGGRVEAERKYLLSEVPPAARQGAAAEILQGWLPGERLRERIRRVRSEGSVRYLRALKQGAGMRRLESEEETPPEVFEALWPLTEGRRIEKRRYTVRDGATAWEVDEFLDRGLVLAEVELPPQAADIPPPEWLRPYIVREVTGDPEYLNENLARTKPARATEPTGRPGDAPEPGAKAAPGPARAREA